MCSGYDSRFCDMDYIVAYALYILDVLVGCVFTIFISFSLISFEIN